MSLKTRYRNRPNSGILAARLYMPLYRVTYRMYCEHFHGLAQVLILRSLTGANSNAIVNAVITGQSCHASLAQLVPGPSTTPGRNVDDAVPLLLLAERTRAHRFCSNACAVCYRLPGQHFLQTYNVFVNGAAEARSRPTFCIVFIFVSKDGDFSTSWTCTGDPRDEDQETIRYSCTLRFNLAYYRHIKQVKIGETSWSLVHVSKGKCFKASSREYHREIAWMPQHIQTTPSLSRCTTDTA